MINFIKENIPFVVLIGQILALTLVVVYFFPKKFGTANTFIEKYSVHIGFLYAFLSLCGSLFYSDILGYEPCKLCWWQRIFMYPLVLMFFLAILKKDRKIFRYGLLLGIIGALLALNHYILQVTGSSILPCSAIGYSVSCSKLFVLSYGYITIPLMAFTAFFGIIMSMLFTRRHFKTDAISNPRD